ncbi:hypothetical protein GCM10022254_29700 [Actinomadura meridiana]|uniref:NB-ARC domain-containing protein n=1 Tax=Actinomadura meridiana TaxID=559626 RepID=A0ABP8C125_9ACTN
MGAAETNESRVRLTARTSGHSQAFLAGRDQTIYYYEAGATRWSFALRELSADDRVPDFVGRREETDQLLRLLDPGGLRAGAGPIELSAGPFGIGRSALALHVAGEAVRRGWYRALYVGLPAPDGASNRIQVEDILPLLLETVHSTERPANDVRAGYHRAMGELAARGERVLLLVDDATDADLDLLEALVTGGPHRLLVTSRSRLGRLRDVSTVSIGALTDDDAVEFLHRLLARDGRGGASRDELLRLAWLCEGRPEALRRAAAYLGDKPESSVDGLVQVMAEEYDALRDGSSGADPSVRAIVELVGSGWGLPPEDESVAEGWRLAGRRAMLGWVRADQRAGRAAGWDIVARPGSGRSTLLQVMGEMLAGAGVSLVFISANWGAEAYDRRRSSSDDPLVVELARVEFCCETVQRIADDLDDDQPQKAVLIDQVRGTRREVEKLLGERPSSQPDLDIKDALLPMGETPLLLDPRLSLWYAERVRRTLRDTAVRVADALGELTAAAHGDRRLTVLVDNVHQITDPVCREWLVEILSRRTHSLVITTRRPGPEPGWPGATTHQLRNLTAAEVAECFRAHLGDDVISAELCARVAARTEGSPQAVALICTALAGRGDQSLDGVLAELNAAAIGAPIIQRVCLVARKLTADKCQDLVGKTEAALPFFDYLTVMNNIDGPLLTAVLAKYDVDEEKAAELMSWLEDERQRSFIGGYDDDEQEGLRIHEAIRDQRRREIPAERLRAIHLHLQAVYRAKVEEFDPDISEEDLHTAYGAWPRYELPGYRRLLREWVYHAVRGQGQALDRETTLGITRVFLEAFWWWGCYVRFPLCDELLRVLDEVVGDRTDADKERLTVLVRFYLNYTRGWRQDEADPERWDEVAGAIRDIRRRAGLDKRAPRPQDEGATVLDVLTLVFRAHAHRFRRPGGDPVAADGCYARAQESVRRHVAVVEDSPHAWYEAWVVYERADLRSEFGDIERATEFLTELDGIAENDPDMDLIDRDLMCRVARLHGDVLYARGDYGEAIDLYARAVMLAYTYHIWQETDQQSANHYSRELHRENATRASAALTRIRDLDPRQWEKGMRRAWEFFAPYRRAAGINEDEPSIDTLFPPPPSDTDLEQLHNPYIERVSKVTEELRDALTDWRSFQGHQA